MPSMADVAMKFFEARETGKGWEACKAYCAQNASFECQADPLAEVHFDDGKIRHMTKIWNAGWALKELG